MSAYYKQLKRDIKQQLDQFSLQDPHTQLAIRAAAAVILAVFFAIFLQAQEPFWAGISAFIVTQATLGSTIDISFTRIMGTIIGSGIGLLLVIIFITQPPIFCLMGFFIGICRHLFKLGNA